MLRLRSTGSKENNSVEGPAITTNSSIDDPPLRSPKSKQLLPTVKSRQHPPVTLNHLLMATAHRKSTAESDTDEDDDLRSLLSGNSLSELRGSQVKNPHRQAQQQPMQISQSSPQPGDSADTSVNMGSHRNNVNLKKSLWILGTIILAVGILGPSSLSWDLFEKEEPTSSYREHLAGTHHGEVHNVERQMIQHGDKHHHLSPQTATMDEQQETFQGMGELHPMIRSTNPMEKAAVGQRRHDQFGLVSWKRSGLGAGRKKKGRRRKGRKDKNGVGKKGGWGIKEAIDNIDKVFMDNRPIAASTEAKNRRSAGGAEVDDAVTDDAAAMDSALAGGNSGNTLPVVHADDDTLPSNADALDAYTYSLPASDALECRSSVVAFVINATDVRDECDGLRKAFDKTCSVVHNGVQAPVVVNTAAGAIQMTRRRKLLEWGRPQLFNLIPEAFHAEVMKAGERLEFHIRGRRLGKKKNRHHHESAARPFRMLREDDGSNSGEIAEEVDAPVVQQHVPPMISLNIPTADKHISEEMLNDALLLQESTSDRKPAKKVFDSNDAALAADANQPQVLPHTIPNITAESVEANKDAAESAEAIRTAVEGVKNIMNDPKSIEARTCCASILSVFHEHCDPTTTGVEDYSDRRLLVVVFVITVCGMVKSLIRHLNIRWLPEAGGCILVGVFGYLLLEHMPHVQFAFDGDMFLRIMVPPIVFEAAVKINKQSFRLHAVPITIFAIAGTLASTAFTAFLLHKGSTFFGGYVTTIPIKESLIFGALISSIDPIAVLSVMNNMGMSDSDTIYVLIFGESLLNDGVAIVLFQTLVHFLDESLVIDGDVVLDAFMHFAVVALGSVTVGMVSGACATVYFAMMSGCQTPMVEVIMFCCWSFIPYYICDMIEWSGIVAIVANGFVMDLYVIGQNHHFGQGSSAGATDDEVEILGNGGGSNGRSSGGGRLRKNQQTFSQRIFNYGGHLSRKADSHVHFVIEIFATLMETAIFAYLGLFLFSPRYHWSGWLTMISIFATVMGRVIMIPLFSHAANILGRMSRSRRNRTNSLANNGNGGVHIDCRMQLILVFAGLRGAMSFALVEHIPMFDTTTGQGSRLKPELKAMTSASVIFTLFVLGGATSYLMERLGYSPNNKQEQPDECEIAPLVPQWDKRRSPSAMNLENNVYASSLRESQGTQRTNGSVRQRGPR